MIATSGRPARLPTSSRYEFEAPIGAGGMGTVYRGLDRQTGRAVAIKVLSVKLSQNPTLHQRLAREFRAASQLEHPNIVRALACENDGEISYLVYELVEGGSVGVRIEQQGRFSEDDAIRIITQIAQALEYAHQRQVIHRDVKPDNILLSASGQAQLTDFGLAKDYAAEDLNLTRHASGLGTPHFMAPEQFADARSVNARSDLYSLAATLYNMLTGQLPFDAKAPIAILAKKETVNLPPARSIVPGLSERVDVAIRAALDPSPDRRPASCLEFFKMVTSRRVLAEDVISTPAPLPKPIEGDDRRTYARYPLRMGTCAGVDPVVHGGGEAEEMWPLIIRDVSSGGIGALLARRFEPGTELSVSLSVGQGDPPQGVDVRVVRVQPERAGHWVHGCAFTRPLDAGQLRALLKFA